MVVSVTLCYSLTANVAHAQFTNLRIFRGSDFLSKDWRPLDVLKSFKNQDIGDGSTSRKGSIDDSSPIKRISMSLFHKRRPIENLAKNHQEPTQDIPVVIDSSPADPSDVKESPIRRVKLPTGSITYSRNFNHTSAGAAIKVNVNPHLQHSSVESTTTSESSTINSAEATTRTEPPTTHCHDTIKQMIIKTHSDTSKNKASAKKKLIDMPNSPIYYVKLPSTAFVSVSRTRQNEDSPDKNAKQSLIFVATTVRPGSVTQTTEAVPTPTESSDLSTTTRRPTRTNSRIVNIKGPFVFNGKPGGIYSAPAPYRPPNYLDILHSIYPKLKRAQFIRR